jgi:hypothetical protein
MTSLLKTIRKDIDEQMSRRTRLKERFITSDNLKLIWARYSVCGLFLSLELYLSEDEIDYVHSHLLKTISILIFTRWDEWPAFRQIFLDDIPRCRSRNDDALPYSVEVLERDDFFGPPYGSEFAAGQHIFIPIVIEEGENMTCDIESRLPFLESGEELIGVGGYGEVSKVVIARGQFLHQTKFERGLLSAVSIKRIISR